MAMPRSDRQCVGVICKKKAHEEDRERGLPNEENIKTSTHVQIPVVPEVLRPWGIPPLQSDWSLSRDHEVDYAS